MANDLEERLLEIPYHRFLGLGVSHEGDAVCLTLPFRDELVGNPLLPALHGGSIGALLETTAIAQLVHEGIGDRLPKTIDITINYLRTGHPHDTHAVASITKRGRRVANVAVVAWQRERERPIATAHAHFLLRH